MKITNIYTLKISLSNERGRPRGTWRIVEIPDTATLERLHKLIFKAFDRYDEHLWSFFFGKPYKKGTLEYMTSFDEDIDFPAEAISGSKVKLATLPFQTTKEIHYLFDYGDEWWHRIKFIGESQSISGVKYPRIIEKHGESPAQYPDVED